MRVLIVATALTLAISALYASQGAAAVLVPCLQLWALLYTLGLLDEMRPYALRFEALRLAAIEAVIADASASSQTRLRRMQWRIDQERRLARTPMGACLRLSRMMWQNVAGPDGLQARLAELQRGARVGGERAHDEGEHHAATKCEHAESKYMAAVP